MPTKTNKIAFYIFLFISLLLFLFLIKNVFNIIFFALVSAIILSPIYNIFAKTPKLNKYVASFFTLLLIFLISLLPIYYFIISLYVETVNLRNFLSLYSYDQILYTVVDTINNSLKQIPVAENYLVNFSDAKNYINTLLSAFYNRLFSLVISVSQSSLGALIKFVLFIVFTIYLIPNLKKSELLFIKYSFLPVEHSKQYIKKFVDFVSAFVQGIIPVAIAQGSIAGLMLLILGVPNSLLLTLAMIFFSIIPFLGSGLFMFVISIIYFISGDVTKALIILVWNLFVVTNIDNVLRTFLISKKTKLNPFVMFFAIIFGIQVFGLPGLFYGPLIVIFLNTSLGLYKSYYRI